MAEQEMDAEETISLVGSQYMVSGFPVLGLPDAARAVKYFSLNPFLPDNRNRCPIECAYCVCHQDGSWHHRPETFAGVQPPVRLMDRLLDIILSSSEGRSGFPISLCDFSDPFIPAHRERVLAILGALIDRGATNLVYITTKVHPGMRFLRQLREMLDRPNGLRVTVFVSLPPLREGYEQASVPGRVRLLQDLVGLGIPCCWYMRPLTEEWYDEDLLIRLARELLPYVSHHVILSGIVMSQEVEEVLRDRGLLVPTWDHKLAGRKQHLSPKFEHHIRTLLANISEELGVNIGPVMGHRLCGTNGNHAYGCLLCARQDRYCQHFQVQQYGTTITSVNSPHLQRLLQRQREEMRAAQAQAALLPSDEECG